MLLPLLLLLLLLLQAAHELLSAVPDEVEVWGWKEPQAIFTLPFLYRVRQLRQRVISKPIQLCHSRAVLVIIINIILPNQCYACVDALPCTG
jgi:hypothetical protein